MQPGLACHPAPPAFMPLSLVRELTRDPAVDAVNTHPLRELMLLRDRTPLAAGVHRHVILPDASAGCQVEIEAVIALPPPPPGHTFRVSVLESKQPLGQGTDIFFTAASSTSLPSPGLRANGSGGGGGGGDGGIGSGAGGM